MHLNSGTQASPEKSSLADKREIFLAEQEEQLKEIAKKLKLKKKEILKDHGGIKEIAPAEKKTPNGKKPTSPSKKAGKAKAP